MTSKFCCCCCFLFFFFFFFVLCAALRLRLCCIYNKRKNLQREGEERDVIPFYLKVVIPALPK